MQLGEAAHAGEQDLLVALDQARLPADFGQDALEGTVVERQDVVARGLNQEQPLQLVQLAGHLAGEVACLGRIFRSVVELPFVVVEGDADVAHRLPRRSVFGHRRPSFVVDAAVAEDLEILRLMPLGRLGIVEAVSHARAVHRLLTDAVHAGWLGDAGGLQHRGGDVDDVVELIADLALRLDSLRPAHDHPVAGALHLLRSVIAGEDDDRVAIDAETLSGSRAACRNQHRAGASSRPTRPARTFP